MKNNRVRSTDKTKLERNFLCQIIDSNSSSIENASKIVTEKTKLLITQEAARLSHEYKMLYFDELINTYKEYLSISDAFFKENILGFFSCLVYGIVFKKRTNNPLINSLTTNYPDILEFFKNDNISMIYLRTHSTLGSYVFFQHCGYVNADNMWKITYDDFNKLINGDIDCEDFFRTPPLDKLRNESRLEYLQETYRIRLKYQTKGNKSIQETAESIYNHLQGNEFRKLKTVWIDTVNNLISYIDKLVGQLSLGQTNKKQISDENCTYDWISKDVHVDDLYEKLIKNGLIELNTSKEDFNAIFSKKPVTEINRLVQWEKGPKLFAYFFDKLTNGRFISNTPKWVNLKYCFTYFSNTKSSYIPIPESVKSNTTKFKYGVKGSDIIDRIFAEIQKKTVK